MLSHKGCSLLLRVVPDRGTRSCQLGRVWTQNHAPSYWLHVWRFLIQSQMSIAPHHEAQKGNSTDHSAPQSKDMTYSRKIENPINMLQQLLLSRVTHRKSTLCSENFSVNPFKTLKTNSYGIPYVIRFDRGMLRALRVQSGEHAPHTTEGNAAREGLPSLRIGSVEPLLLHLVGTRD